MSSYRYILSFLLLNLFGLVQAQTLEDYVKEAAENNPGLKAKYAEFEAALQRVSQSNALPDPTLSFGYFIIPVETRVGPQQAKISLSQMFPWFGTLSAKGDVSSYLAEAKYQEFLDSRNALVYQVKAAWYPLYEVEQMLLLQKKNRDILLTYKDLATSSFKNGKGSMVDVIRVDIMIENSITEIKLLEDKTKPLSTHFNSLLNRADTTPIFVADTIPFERVAPDYRKDSLLLANPLLASLKLKQEAALAQEELARKQGLPNFGVGIDYILIGKRTDMDLPDNGKNALMPMVSIGRAHV